MSAAATPSRSMGASEASTPSSTHENTVSNQLTPRSKIKAMLAALDDESEDDSSSVRNLDSKRTKQMAADIEVRRRTETADEVFDAINMSDDDEEVGSDVIVPRGKLAARLHCQKAASRNAEVSSDDLGIGANAYRRIKQQVKEKAHQINDVGLPEKCREIEDQEVPLTRRFLQRRKKQGAKGVDNSPISPISPSSRGPSPGLLFTPVKPRPVRSASAHAASPGLFLTPKRASPSATAGVRYASNSSDSDLPEKPQANARFLALVAKKREERQAKAAAEEKKRADRESRVQAQRDVPARLSDDDTGDDKAVEAKLTQQARPTRKASKKALEEMNRETQRMSRNMQLAHQAKTKKKVTKESLLAKFNFRCNPTPPTTASQTHGSTTASSAPVSDIEGVKEHCTPPTSPLKPNHDFEKLPDMKMFDTFQYCAAVPLEDSIAAVADADDELPNIQDILDAPILNLDKGKGIATEQPLPDAINTFLNRKRKTFTQPAIRVIPRRDISRPRNTSDSCDDLEVLPKRKVGSRKLDVFDKLPAKKVTEERSLQRLRALAHLTSPGRQTDKSRASMTPGEMQASLQKRARQQAAKERAEKIQDLKDRGIFIQTTEERLQDQAEVEDLLEKARQEGEELTKKEKDASKKERRENGMEDDSSDDDEEYREAEADADIPNLELSGSDDEADDEAPNVESIEGSEDEERGDEEDEEDEEENGVTPDHGRSRLANLVEDEASEDSQDSGSDAREQSESEKDADDQLPIVLNKRRSRISRVVDDEDNDECAGFIHSDAIETTKNPMAPQIPGSDEAPMGLTQAFEATMAETQTQIYSGPRGMDCEQDSLNFLRGMPDPGLPMIDADSTESLVPDSQAQTKIVADSPSQITTFPEEIDIHLSQSQLEHDTFPRPSQLPPISSQYSDIPDPTQDAGFGSSSPLGERFMSVPPSTVDTVLLSQSANREVPIVKKKGRLRPRGSTVQVLSDTDAIADEGRTTQVHAMQDSFEISANAFDVMKKAKANLEIVHDPFDKKKSEAKGMVEEQAEESEDEYAGLGGDSDDESMAEEDEEVRKMIDEGEVKVDERKLAAFYADKERVSDEKAVEKLFKDINNGMLRRKRGAEFDLSDSDDDLEARRRAKRREFAKMRKALLENENVGKIAEDPKKLAFLRAIEDREDDDDIEDDFLEQPEEPIELIADSQEKSELQAQPSPPEPANNKRKRPLQESIPDSGNRGPPATRRIPKMKKPSTLAEIRASVSFLIEEPEAAAQHPPSSSEPESASEEPLVRDPFAQRRRSDPIIDRLSLKRAESASTSTSAARLAFHDPNTLPAPGFKVPSLLRRATTQVTDQHGITTAETERAAGGGEKGDFVRRGGTKRSSINYFAREMERTRGVKEVERRREEGRRKVAERRKGVLGLLGAGRFS